MSESRAKTKKSKKSKKSSKSPAKEEEYSDEDIYDSDA